MIEPLWSDGRIILGLGDCWDIQFVGVYGEYNEFYLGEVEVEALLRQMRDEYEARLAELTQVQR